MPGTDAKYRISKGVLNRNVNFIFSYLSFFRPPGRIQLRSLLTKSLLKDHGFINGQIFLFENQYVENGRFSTIARLRG